MKMRDLLNSYQTMFPQDSQLQEKCTTKKETLFTFQAASRQVRRFIMNSSRREINSTLNPVEAQCNRTLANFEVQ